MLQRRFRYVLVDEWQDTNRVEYEVVRLLAAPSDNLFVVGDPDQTIYSFSGADVRIILDFNKVYPAAPVIRLDVNYRSTTGIIGLGNAVIRQNRSRIPNTLQGVKSAPAEPGFVRPDSSFDEADYLVQKVRADVNAGVRTFRDYAVLYRTTAASQALIEQLLDGDIPFIDHADQKASFFYETSSVKPIMSLLKLSIAPDNMEDIRAVLPSLYVKRDEGMAWIQNRQSIGPVQRPLKHLGEMPGLTGFRRNKLRDQIDRLDQVNALAPKQAIQFLRPDYEAFALQRKGHILTNYKDTVKEALDTLEQLAARHQTVAGFIRYVDDLKRRYDKMRGLRQQPDPDAMNLMTIHKSKGLEFPVVWAIGFSDGILPHRLALEATQPRDVFVGKPKSSTTNPMLEEERRLAYVCITRARDELIISSPAEYRGKKAEVSVFLREVLLPAKRPEPERKTDATGKVARPSASRASSSPNLPVKRHTHEVLAWVCTSEACSCWERILSFGEANLDSKTCPVCGQPMVQQSKDVTDAVPPGIEHRT